MKIFVGIPVYQDVPVSFVHGLLNLVTQPPAPLEPCFVQGVCYISRARDILVDTFLKSDCTHLLFIDSDIIFTNANVVQLIKRNKDIVCGLYPKKQTKLEWVVEPFKGQNKPDAEGLLKVEFGGTGFMLIARKVFDDIVEKLGKQIVYFDDEYGKDMYDFFPTGPLKKVNNRWLGEDWHFSQMARDAGHDIWVDTHCQLRHMGIVFYPLDSYQDRE